MRSWWISGVRWAVIAASLAACGKSMQIAVPAGGASAQATPALVAGAIPLAGQLPPPLFPGGAAAAGALTLPAMPLPTPTPPPPPPRVLMFPEEGDFGKIYQRNWGTQDQWLTLAQANGRITLGASQATWLEVHREGGEDLTPLGALTADDVHVLDLSMAYVDDAALDHIAGLTKLEQLNLNNTRVTDEGLARLSGLTELRMLFLDNDIGVTDAGIKHLAGLAKLQTLILWNTAVGDGAFETLMTLPMLQVLNLNGTRVTDKGMEDLGTMTGILDLWMQYAEITDAGLAHLANLKSLRTLDLTGAPITDAGLAHLKGLAGLTWIGLNGTQVTVQGLKDLRAALPNTGFAHPKAPQATPVAPMTPVPTPRRRPIA